MNNRKIDGVQLVCGGAFIAMVAVKSKSHTSCSGNTTTNERETLSNSPQTKSHHRTKQQRRKPFSFTTISTATSPATIGSSKQTKNRLLYSRWLPQAPPKDFFFCCRRCMDRMAHMLGKEPRRDRSAKMASTKWVTGRCKKVAKT